MHYVAIMFIEHKNLRVMKLCSSPEGFYSVANIPILIFRCF